MGDFPYLEWLTRAYAEKAEATRSWIDCLKAHGLANACVAQDPERDRYKPVYDIECSWYDGRHPLTYQEHQSLTNEHKQLLKRYRIETKINFDSLKEEQESLSISDVFSDANIKCADAFSKNVFSMSTKCTEDFVQFSQKIIQSSVDVLDFLNLNIPCDYAVIALGSVARSEATPYSDLEYAFIVDSDTEDEYFTMLAIDSYFRIGNLCETPLKCFDIDEVCSGQAVFSNTMSGYRIDGISGNAGNIPTGKEGGQRFILTVEDFVNLHKMWLTSPTTNRVGDSGMLSTTALIYSSEGMESAIYSQLLEKRLSFEMSEAKYSLIAKRKRFDTLLSDIKRYSVLPEFNNFDQPSNTNVKIKVHVFRYPTLFANIVKVLLHLESENPWHTSSILRKQELLSNENHRYFDIILAISIYIRTSGYLALGAQSELLSLFSSLTCDAFDRYHVPLNLFVILSCLLVPMKLHIKGCVQKLTCLSNLESMETIEVVRPLLSDLKIYEDDYMLKAEVLYFAGQYKMALDAISNGIGERIETANCGRFVELMRIKYRTTKTSAGEHKYLKLCCYLLYATEKFDQAIKYIRFFIFYENLTIQVAQWKLILADCMNKMGSHEEARELLDRAIASVHEFLCLDTKESVPKYLQAKLANSATDVFHKYKDISMVLANLLRVSGHNYTAKTKFAEAVASTQHALKLYELLSEGGINCEWCCAQSYSVLAAAHTLINEYRKSLILYKKSNDILRTIYGKFTNHPNIADNYGKIAAMYYYMKAYKISLEYHIKALRMRVAIHGETTNHESIATCYNNIAALYSSVDQPATSLEYYSKSLLMLKALHGDEANHPKIANCYKSMAVTNSVLGDLEKSLDNSIRSLAMNKALNGEEAVSDDVATAYRIIGHCHFFSCNYGQSLYCYEKCLKMEKLVFGENTNHHRIATTYNKLGTLHSTMDDVASALEYHFKSLKMLITLSDKSCIIDTYIDIGILYYRMGEYEKALKYYTNGLLMAQ